MAGNAQQTMTSTIQQPPVAAESVISGGALLSQVGTALCGVLLLILLVAWVLRKLGFAPQAKNSNVMKMVATYPVGQRERIVIVEVDNTWLVLGITAQQITHLHTLSARSINDSPSAESITPADFLQFLKKATKRPEKTE